MIYTQGIKIPRLWRSLGFDIGGGSHRLMEKVLFGNVHVYMVSPRSCSVPIREAGQRVKRLG